MAAKPPNRGSRSEPTVTDPVAWPILAGEQVTPRRRDATASGGPGVLTVVAVIDGQTRETTGDEALERLPELLRRPDASVWVDLSGPSREQVEQVGAALGLHPLIVEDVLEGNQRAKIEITDGIVHIVLFYLDYDAELTASELDIVLGLGYLFTAHDSTWEPRATHHLRSGVGPILRARAGPSPVGARRRRRRRVLPVRGSTRLRDRRDPGRGRPEREAGDPRARCSR